MKNPLNQLCTSYSTPIANSNAYYLREEEQKQNYPFRNNNQFLKEIGQVKQDIVRFKNEMNGLVKQLDGMEIDLNHSKDRVRKLFLSFFVFLFFCLYQIN